MACDKSPLGRAPLQSGVVCEAPDLLCTPMQPLPAGWDAG